MRFHSWISRQYPWLPEKIRSYIDLVRPFTLLAPLLGCLAFGLFALIVDTGQDLDWYALKILVYGAVTLALVNAGSNIFNQANEVEIDQVNKPDRPIPAGRVDEDEALVLAIILYGFAMARALFMPPYFGMGVMWLAFITMLYSHPVIYLKKRYVVNNLTMAIARGYLGPWTAWCLFGDPWAPVVHGACLILAVWTFGGICTKDMPDLEGDRKHGIRTFPVVIGVQRTRHLVTASMIAPFVMVPIMIQGSVFVSSMIWFLLLSPLGVGIVVAIYGRDPASMVENRVSWVLMYILFMAMLLSFPVIYLLA